MKSLEAPLPWGSIIKKAPAEAGAKKIKVTHLPIFGGSRKAIAKKRVEMARARIRM